jgi:HEAT repeat protein
VRLEKLLAHDADDRVRSVAAEALGRLKDPRADTALLQALEDPYFGVKFSATAGLAKLGNAAAHRYLLTVLDDGLPKLTPEQSQAVQFLAGKALAEMRSVEAIPTLQRLAKECEESSARKLREFGESYRRLIAEIVGEAPDRVATSPP